MLKKLQLRWVILIKTIKKTCRFYVNSDYGKYLQKSLNKMKLIKTDFKDLIIIKHNVYEDERGFFKEKFKKEI